VATSEHVPSIRVRVPRGARCRYYVNTNFFVDLEEDVNSAVTFARRHRGLCTSSILIWEYREVGQGRLARRIARLYRIVVVRVNVRRAFELALENLARPGSSYNTVLDYAHILVALNTPGVNTFVTGDEDSCRRALSLGLYCLNHRTGDEYAPPQG